MLLNTESFDGNVYTSQYQLIVQIDQRAPIGTYTARFILDDTYCSEYNQDCNEYMLTLKVVQNNNPPPEFVSWDSNLTLV